MKEIATRIEKWHACNFSLSLSLSHVRYLIQISSFFRMDAFSRENSLNRGASGGIEGASRFEGCKVRGVRRRRGSWA